MDWALLIATVRFGGSLLILAVVYTNHARLGVWAARYSAEVPYLGYLLVLSIAGHAFWRGTEVLIARLIHGRSRL